MSRRDRIKPALVRFAALFFGFGSLFFGCGDGRSESALVGSQARALLTAAPYSRLVVELDYVDTHPPSMGAVALLEARLAERLNKPGGITVVVDDAIPPVVGPTSLAQLVALEQRHRDRTSAGDVVVVYVLYLNGESSSGAYIGQAYGPLSFCIFKEIVDQSASRLASPEEIERATVVHELGHLLGLVNLGTPMVVNHEDPAYRAHDVSQRCVMHHQIETLSVRVLIENDGAPPHDFDEACVADLRVNGGK